MDMKTSRLQVLLEELVGADVDELLKNIDLRELILYSKSVHWVNDGLKRLAGGNFRVELHGRWATMKTLVQSFDRAEPISSDPVVHWRRHIEVLWALVKTVESVDGLAIRVTANNDMSDSSSLDGKLQSGWFGVDRDFGESTIVRSIWNHISGISNHEHISHLRLSESSWQHSRIHAGEHDSGWARVIPDLLELLDKILTDSFAELDNSSQDFVHL